MIRRVVLILIALFVSHSAAAQMSDDYRFVGTVVDPAGKPIKDVQVTLRNVANGDRIVFKTHGDGTFDRRMIPAAKYEAVFEKAGYSTRTQPFDWSVSTEETETVEVKVVMQSDQDATKKALSKQAAQLYDDAYAALAKNDCATAAGKANELLKMGAGDYEYAVRFILARCHANQQELPQAVEEYRRVIALKPDFFEAHYDLATVLEKQGQHDAALMEYAEADSLKSGNFDVNFNRGAILLQQNKYDEARPHLEKATQIDSTNATAFKALGYAYLQGEHKDMQAARRNLERYLALKPDAPDAQDVRGIIADLKKASTP
jgi:tetratricopeptide (TPR) repeat protein